MSSNPPDPNAPKPGGLQSMLARLRGMVSAQQTPEEPASEEELLPTFDVPLPEPPAAEPPPPPVALPADGAAAGEVPPVATPAEEAEPAPVDEAPAEAVPAEPAAPPRPCPICGAARGTLPWCDSCGYQFPADEEPAVAVAVPVAAEADPPARVRGRYELTTLLGERGGVARFQGLDHGDGSGPAVPVTIVRSERPAVAEVVEAPEAEGTGAEEVLPAFDDAEAAGPVTERLPANPEWPGPGWERNLLELAQHPGLPAVLDSFTEGNFDYLVEELPAGRPLWDAWDDPDATAEQRFGWLRQVAEAVQDLHRGGAILEGLRPGMVVVTDDGAARLADLADLLPLPVPADAPIRATFYTAPELVLDKAQADARANLYSFGALLYALHVGRELAETDFERQGKPKPFIPRFPDIHPAFGRLVTKTFCPEVAGRFPTDEAAREDPSGFTELIHTLEVCGRTLDDCRLEVAAWTTTGMVRTGNEDAFALLHSVESRMDDTGESALVLLCDGMGGYEAGEVAAAMAIQALRKNLVGQKLFRALAGGAAFPAPGQQPDADPPEPFDVEACKRLLSAALKDTNKQVYAASRLPAGGRRTMGCTAEAVYVTGRHVIVGHVGDSRTYHLSEGRLIQLTRDQTLVNRLVELGTLAPEEAENHPRKNELQQAIGGQPNVEPGLYHGRLKPGDWVVVCSDGVSNHVSAEDLQHMLQSEATSADMAARRLVNFVNIHGATDNATIVVIRAC
jgi:PPM family protein phosphatase